MIWLLQISLYTHSLLVSVLLTSVCFVLLHLHPLPYVLCSQVHRSSGNQIAKYSKYQIFSFPNVPHTVHTFIRCISPNRVDAGCHSGFTPLFHKPWEYGCLGLPVFSFSLRCQFHTVPMQAMTMQQLTGFHCPLLIVGGKQGHFCALQVTFLFLQQEQVEAKLSSKTLPPSPCSSTDQGLTHPQRKHKLHQQRNNRAPQ